VDDKTIKSKLSAEYDKAKQTTINALLKGYRVELIPVKDGVKVVKVRREEVKRLDCLSCKAWNRCLSAAQEGRLVKCISFGYVQEHIQTK